MEQPAAIVAVENDIEGVSNNAFKNRQNHRLSLPELLNLLPSSYIIIY